MYGQQNQILAQQAMGGAITGGHVRVRGTSSDFEPAGAELQKRSEFSECREQAYMAMNSLSECISELERRLGPVLRPVPMPATASGANQATMPALSGVADAMFGIGNHARSLQERVVALLEALAV